MPLNVDGFDTSEMQGSPDFGAMQARTFHAVRVLDGGHHDPTFGARWAQLAGMDIRYLFAYLLVSDNDPQGQVDAAVTAIVDSGVAWRPGMGIALDVENTKWHPIASPETALFIGGALCQRFARTAPLIYSYHASWVHGWAQQNHWPLWLAWPTSDPGDLPADSVVTVHQWGTAAPGEQPGFADDSVDVNRVFGDGMLDVICGYSGLPTKEGFTMSDLETIQAMLNTGIDNLAAADVRLQQATQATLAALDAHMTRLEALVSTVESHEATVAQAADAKTFITQVAKVLAAGAQSM